MFPNKNFHPVVTHNNFLHPWFNLNAQRYLQHLPAHYRAQQDSLFPPPYNEFTAQQQHNSPPPSYTEFTAQQQHNSPPPPPSYDYFLLQQQQSFNQNQQQHTPPNSIQPLDEESIRNMLQSILGADVLSNNNTNE